MDVIELLAQHIFRINIHVEIAALPEAPWRPCGECQAELSSVAPLFAAQDARDPLLKHLDGLGRSQSRRFADQQMDMIRHENVTDNPQLEACAHLAENTYSNIFVFDRSEEFAPLVASERNEMEILAASDALELVGHKKESPTLANTARVGHSPRCSLTCAAYHTLVSSQ